MNGEGGMRAFLLASVVIALPVVAYAQPLTPPPTLGAVVPGSAAGNVGYGTGALAAITTGTGNVVIGNGAGSKLTSGTNNLLLGNAAASTALATGSNNIVLAVSNACDPGAATTGIFQICALTGSTPLIQASLGAAGGNMFLNRTGGDTFVGPAGALLAAATIGFFHFPFVANPPTGTPTNTTDACVYNTTSNNLNCYNGAGWFHLTFTAGAQ